MAFAYEKDMVPDIHHPEVVTICWLGEPVKVPLGMPLPVQLICVNGIVWPAPSRKGTDESAVKTLVAERGIDQAKTGTGLVPEDTPGTAPVPGSWLTVNLTTSMVPPLVPTLR
jgi:hypothetical protein